jgi:hypothetical protein
VRNVNIVLVIFLAMVGASAYATVGVWLGRRLLRGRVAEGHHEVLVGLFQTGGTLYAVFLAFLVVVVWQSYDAARANVAEEASALATLYRASTGMEASAGNSLRELIRAYAKAVIDDEWTIQAEVGGASPKARAASLAMYRLFGQENPAVKQRDAAIDGAVLEIISQIQSDRNKRTLEAEQSLPAIIWFAAIGSGAIILSMGFFLFMEQAAPQIIVTSIMASTIALLLSVMFALSRPFVGPVALDPKPFEHSLQVFDSVDAMR